MSKKEVILHSLSRSDFVRRTYTVFRSIPIFGLGLRNLVHAAMPVGTRLWIRIPEGLGKGFWMYADPRFEPGYINGDHEPWIQDLLKTELGQGGCYYDAGAHSGFFCMIAARCVGLSGTVLALEPDPKNASTLKANIARNDLMQVTVLEIAAWSSTGQVTFEQDAELSNRTQGHISPGERSDCARISVPAVRLDDLVFREGRRAPDLVKVDVEGAEWDVLQGARRILSEAKPKLLCEVHDPTEMGRIRTYIESFGYMAEEWKPVHPHYADYRQLYLWAYPRP